MPRIARIILYPIKSLPGIEVTQAELTEAGALTLDRAYSMVDQSGSYVNGKNEPGVHALRTHLAVDAGRLHVTLGDGVAATKFDLPRETAAFAEAVSQQLGRCIRLRHDAIAGFPDDTDSPGPTIISDATLREVASWYPGRSVEEMRARFRANIEITDCPPFWEDGLFGPPGVARRIAMGAAELVGVNPCRRCVVPTRDPLTGEPLRDFQRIFVQRRRETLPPWAEPSRFDFFYRLAVNTRAGAGQAGGVIRVDDPVGIL